MDTPSEVDSSLSQPEREIRAYLASNAHAAAATLLLRTYADEILGYLINMLGDRELAREVFAVFASNLWQGLPGLELRTTARAWSYSVARHAALRMLDQAARKRSHEQPVANAPPVAVETRPTTPAYLLSENKRRVSALRARLSREEQELLTLRIDRGFDFREIAVALGAAPDELEVAAARHRKRFQLVKRKLTKWLAEQGPSQN